MLVIVVDGEKVLIVSERWRIVVGVLLVGFVVLISAPGRSSGGG